MVINLFGLVLMGGSGLMFYVFGMFDVVLSMYSLVLYIVDFLK